MEMSAVWTVLLRVVYALLVLGAASLVAGWLTGVAAFALDRTRLDPLVRRMLVRLVKPLVLLIGIGAALNVLALESVSTSIAALIGGATLAIGLALRGYLADAAAGAVILTVRPFNAGDAVEVSGASGVVREVGLFFTLIDDYDGNTQWVPNEKVASGVIENISSKGTRRVVQTIAVARDSDVDKLREAILAYVEQDERFLSEPAPSVTVDAIASHGLDLGVRGWAKNADYGAAGANLREALLTLLKQQKVGEPRDVYRPRSR